MHKIPCNAAGPLALFKRRDITKTSPHAHSTPALAVRVHIARLGQALLMALSRRKAPPSRLSPLSSIVIRFNSGGAADVALTAYQILTTGWLRRRVEQVGVHADSTHKDAAAQFISH